MNPYRSAEVHKLPMLLARRVVIASEVSRCIASSATAKVNVPDRPVGQICSIQKSSSGSTPQIKKLFVVSEMHLIFSTSLFSFGVTSPK